MEAINRRQLPAYLAALGSVAVAADALGQSRLSVGRTAVRMTLDGTRFWVYCHKPRGTIRGVLLVFHGTDRNADDYCYRAVKLADAHGLIVAAPLFDAERFSSTAYHRGNMLTTLPPAKWNTRFAPLLLQEVRRREGADLKGYIFGFSAGGQYVSRVAAAEQLPGVVRIVSGGASSYVQPTGGVYPNGEKAPYGFGGLPDEQQRLRAYLQQPYSILCGSLDNDPNAPNLTGSAAADRQGATRLERARNTYEAGQRAAATLGIQCAWDYFVVPNVAHSSSRILRSIELQRALRLQPVTL